MRGERRASRHWRRSRRGSSPHARGTRRHHSQRPAHSRFIPACAGNAPHTTPEAVTVHGSSPHARGTLGLVTQQSLLVRFIPACAGNASPPPPPASSNAVHPRMRGEREVLFGGRCWATGSSPHARGTRVADTTHCSPVRFIPACAGNASIGSIRLSCVAVHPRMRGERCSDCGGWSQSRGSSPHARGTRSRPMPAGGD